MIVFSNRRLGPAAELLVSAEVAQGMLRETAEAASEAATDRWERELGRWLQDRAAVVADSARVTDVLESGRISWRAPNPTLDVSEVAWSPENFERQRRFLIEAINRAANASEHTRALSRWAAMIEAHPRDSVQVGRRWGMLATV